MVLLFIFDNPVQVGKSIEVQFRYEKKQSSMKTDEDDAQTQS